MSLPIAGFLAAEGSFGVDPSSDGSGYTAIRTIAGLGMFKKGRKLLEQGWSIGRLRKVRKRVGPDGAEITLSIPYRGYAAAALESASLSTTLDESDLILNSAFGVGTSIPGLGASSVGSTSFVSTGDDRNIGEALAIYEAGQNGGRAQWRIIDTESPAGTYAVRALIGTFTTAAFSFGFRRWFPNVVPSAGFGASLAMHLVLANGSSWTLLGGRPSGAIKIVHSAGEESRLECTLMFDHMVRGSKASLPVITTFAPAAIMGQLSSFVWGGTEYETASMSIEIALGTNDRKATSGVNGRSNITPRTADCKVSIAPPFGTGWEDDFDGGTVRRLEMTHGSALYASGSPGTLNSSFFWAEAAQIINHDTTDDNSEPRHTIDFDIDDGVLSDGSVARYWSLARA